MRVALVVFALIGLGCSAPQPKKLFHEHFNEFLEIIMEEAGHEIDHILFHYLEFDEFVASMDYLKTNSFRDLVNEMENLSEFQAVVDFLENDNIDVHYFLDLFDEMLENAKRAKKTTRHGTSGANFSSFLEDSIALFPKNKLSALFDQKMADDDEFRTTIENLRSVEWISVFNDLLQNEVFQVEVQTLADNGINIYEVMFEVIAIFGQ